jgi:prepilin-type N-terminal cleavage/methylation domain-containing protein
MAAKHSGFTMIEVIATVIILAILAAVIYAGLGFLDTELSARAGLVRNQIRYAQLRAMKGGALYGLRCQSNVYWLFAGDPSSEDDRVALPGEEGNTVSLAGTGVGMADFTLFFDANGRPYSSYTSSASNTPVSTALPLNIVLTKDAASLTLSVTPETGFVP